MSAREAELKTFDEEISEVEGNFGAALPMGSRK